MDIANVASTLIESALVVGLIMAIWKKHSVNVKKNSSDIEIIQKDYITKNDLEKHKESIDGNMKEQKAHVESRLKEHKEDWQRAFDQLLEMLGKNDEKTGEILKIVLEDRRKKWDIK